jgi:hypothetical protein
VHAASHQQPLDGIPHLPTQLPPPETQASGVPGGFIWQPLAQTCCDAVTPFWQL